MDIVPMKSSSNVTGQVFPKVVIVDDYEDSCKLLSELLSPFYDCSYTSDASYALQLINDTKPDLIILDYRMPVINGLDICRMVRQNQVTKNIPIVFISGTATVDEKIQAFENGADDFISKPFNTKELILRMKLRLGKNQALIIQELKASNLHMNLASRQVFIDNEEVSLTPKQFDILKMLLQSQNNLVTREQCLNEIWGNSDVTARNVDSQVNYLKRKLAKFNGRIVAVTSLGYRLEIN
ncbi:MAG: response regulator transcription factor [Pseudobdellovibrionaceae bacterium]